MLSPSIKAKMAKILALQGSTNPNEAANAVTKLEEMCREYGVTPSELVAADEYDESNDSPESVTFLKGKRVSRGLQLLLDAIVEYFDGTQVWAHNDLGHGYQMEVFATKGNLIQIELYFDYLQKEAQSQGEAAKLLAISRGYPVRGFIFNFHKGFATAIRSRLTELKETKHREGVTYSSASSTPGVSIQHTISALTIQDKSKKDKSKALMLRDLRFPKLTTISTSTPVGRGYNDGRAAGNATSLNSQISSGSPKQLTGR